MYEEEQIPTGEVKQRNYIFAGGEAIAISEQSSITGETLRYLHKDHLGSIMAYSDKSGKLVQELSYDAWGRRRIHRCGAQRGQPHANREGDIYRRFLGAASAGLNFLSADPNIAAKLFKHAFSNMWLEGVRGGNMKHGLLSGLASAAGGSAIEKYGLGMSRAVKVAANAVVGGTAEELGGGKFANGAITGAFSMLFNDLMHKEEEKKEQRNKASIAAKKTRELISHPNLEVESYKTSVTEHNSLTTTLVYDVYKRNIVEVNTWGVSLGTDGSISAGGLLKIGYDPNRKSYIFDASIPVGKLTNTVITIKIDRNITNSVVATAVMVIATKKFKPIGTLKPIFE